MRVAMMATAIILSCSAAAVSSAPDRVLVLTNANVIDGVSAQPLRGMTVVVRGGRIEQVVPVDTTTPPAGATVIDLGGRWLLPGLIDAHVHFRDLASARAALRSGVTTARSLGIDHYADVGIRELHRSGAADVPDVIAGGYHVRPRAADAFFLDHPQLRALRQGVSGADAVRQFVRALQTRGVGVIKTMATDRAGLPETDFRRRALSDEELAAAVGEASKAGLRVAAHAHTDDGALAAIRAGVHSIEHGTLMTDSTLRLMKQRGVCFVPTLTFWLDMLEPGGEYDHPLLAARARDMLPRAREVASRASSLGVLVAAGSDMRYDQTSPHSQADEIAALVTAGLSPMMAIRAGTSGAARCLGIDERTGSVRAGLDADLIVVDGDPTADIATLERLVLVVNDGEIAIDRLVNR